MLARGAQLFSAVSWVGFGHPERLRVPWPRCRAGQTPTDLGAGLLLLGGWHLVLGSHHQLGRLLPWEGNSAG